MKTVWLTRPPQQAGMLEEGLRARGMQVLRIPMLDIEPVKPDRAALEAVMNLDRYAMVIFISTNAARHGLECIRDYWPQEPVGILWLAVGPGTARALQAEGLDARFPARRISSEGLLELPELREVAGKRALIVRGVGGREVLAEALRERGCQVDYAEVYRRVRPEYPLSWLLECLDRQPDAVVISSAEALENFAVTFEPLWPELKQEAPLYLSSPRLLQAARGQGFEKLTPMSGADDASIVAALEQ